MKPLLTILLAFSAQFFSIQAFAEPFDASDYSSSLDFAQVTHVVASQSANGSWCFNTSVEHNDEGWEHYADGWAVMDLDGNQLGFRKLLHPHENEQPFTRSQCNIQIPDDVTQVVVIAQCNVHGFGGKPVVLDLKAKQGDGFIVNRYK